MPNGKQRSQHVLTGSSVNPKSNILLLLPLATMLAVLMLYIAVSSYQAGKHVALNSERCFRLAQIISVLESLRGHLRIEAQQSSHVEPGLDESASNAYAVDHGMVDEDLHVLQRLTLGDAPAQLAVSQIGALDESYGKKTFDSLRQQDFDLIHTLQNSEENRLLELTVQSRTISNNALQIVMINSALSIALLALSKLIVWDDVQERRRLTSGQDRLVSILENTSDYVASADHLGNIVYCNRAFMESLIPHNGPTTHLKDIFHPDYLGQYLDEIIPATIVDGTWRGESVMRRNNGTFMPVSLVVASHKPSEGTAELFSLVARDITDSKDAQQQIALQLQRIQDYNVALEFQMQALEDANKMLETLATKDGLTGLRNHRAFQERLADECRRAAARGRSIGLLMIDVDHFKEYNDTYGHPAGDQVLIKLGSILEQTVRDTDMAARYGGEEFAVLLPDTGQESAIAVAERLRSAMEEVKLATRTVTLSIGVCSAYAHERSPQDIIRCADQSLYRSKALGRNRVTCGCCPLT